MRPASSYRSQRKKDARAQGISLKQHNANIDRVIREQEARSVAAREQLGIWARNGGRETAVSAPISPDALKAMNQRLEPLGQKEHIAQQQAEAAKKITVEDIDKAMERLLSKWQEDGNINPLPLSPLFAARARQIGWIEGVEFSEDRS